MGGRFGETVADFAAPLLAPSLLAPMSAMADYSFDQNGDALDALLKARALQQEQEQIASKQAGQNPTPLYLQDSRAYLANLQKRFERLVSSHTATEGLLASGGGDLPAPGEAGFAAMAPPQRLPSRVMEPGDPLPRSSSTVQEPSGRAGMEPWRSRSPVLGAGPEQLAGPRRLKLNYSTPALLQATACGGSGASQRSSPFASTQGSPKAGSHRGGSSPEARSRRFTYGLSAFDDDTVEKMLAVDHAARQRPERQDVSRPQGRAVGTMARGLLPVDSTHGAVAYHTQTAGGERRPRQSRPRQCWLGPHTARRPHTRGAELAAPRRPRRAGAAAGQLGTGGQDLGRHPGSQ